MKKGRTFAAGTKVKVLDGKHKDKLATVEHSDASITSVRFENSRWSDPVWTKNLEAVTE